MKSRDIQKLSFAKNYENLFKAMGKDKIMEFPFPSPPELQQIQAGEQHLIQLGALDGETKKIKPLGRTIAPFPVSPR